MSHSIEEILDNLSELHPKKEKTNAYLKSFFGKEIDLHNAEREGDAYKWKIGSFDDTIYKDERDFLKQWEECYLPDYMTMQVLGEVRHTSWDSEDPSLVLMVCEDGKIYAYDDQHLHLVAKSLKALNTGITFPSETVYYYGQRFENMTEEELEEVRNSKEMKKVKEKYQQVAQMWGSDIVKAFNEMQECHRAQTDQMNAILNPRPLYSTEKAETRELCTDSIGIQEVEDSNQTYVSVKSSANKTKATKLQKLGFCQNCINISCLKSAL